jgi:hypothetical protein
VCRNHPPNPTPLLNRSFFIGVHLRLSAANIFLYHTLQADTFTIGCPAWHENAF